jgi:hypothetical protein
MNSFFFHFSNQLAHAFKSDNTSTKKKEQIIFCFNFTKLINLQYCKVQKSIILEMIYFHRFFSIPKIDTYMDLALAAEKQKCYLVLFLIKIFLLAALELFN